MPLLLTLIVALTGCGQSNASRAVEPAGAPQASIPGRRVDSAPRHDLAADEALGGHTLARHVARTDEELRDRLRREPDISSASTYTDRATAEAVVGAALSSAPPSFEAWRNRTGRRPNFVLHFDAHRVIGRSIARGSMDAVPCERALVVMRWNDRQRAAFVLTSYPEERR